ncbi:helix-turn-helix domain-containing protein [Paenibacillus silvisoli]|uniref:helix-turn-helix domain-containing protein n=1 Tax=Paenibacillus silvisoli TaxID=3110539 RepID=UPI0028046C46|nr:helix-turn-helix domain-containing protein [Paenibacillus silvisoli]
MARSTLNLYLACEEMDFSWDEKEIFRFESLWRQGMAVFQIAKELRRDPDEVALLIIDRSRKKAIAPRKGGIWGEEYQDLRKQMNQNRKGLRPGNAV